MQCERCLFLTIFTGEIRDCPPGNASIRVLSLRNVDTSVDIAGVHLVARGGGASRIRDHQLMFEQESAFWALAFAIAAGARRIEIHRRARTQGCIQSTAILFNVLPRFSWSVTLWDKRVLQICGVRSSSDLAIPIIERQTPSSSFTTSTRELGRCEMIFVRKGSAERASAGAGGDYTERSRCGRAETVGLHSWREIFAQKDHRLVVVSNENASHTHILLTCILDMEFRANISRQDYSTHTSVDFYNLRTGLKHTVRAGTTRSSRRLESRSATLGMDLTKPNCRS